MALGKQADNGVPDHAGLAVDEVLHVADQVVAPPLDPADALGELSAVGHSAPIVE
jgi:hypothetical protein